MNVGEKYGRLTLVSEGPRSKCYSRQWNCVCDCGMKRLVRQGALRTGKTQSCGCLNRELLAEHRKQLSGSSAATGRRENGEKTRAYRIWALMKNRCHCETSASYRLYGARGIKVCDRWRESFDAFLADMGHPPEGRSIDRIDNERGYEPGNCRWATPSEQAQNTRRVKLWHGAVDLIRERSAAGLSQKQIAVELGCSQGAITDAVRGKSWAKGKAA